MAAGLGTRLRPLTYEIPKPMVPVANRPVMEHILRLLARHGFSEVVANLHWFPDTIRERFGDGSALGHRSHLQLRGGAAGTAGGVRNVAVFFGDEPFLVMAGDALTDIDLGGAAGGPRGERRHRDARREAGPERERVRGRDHRRRRPGPGIPGEARPGRGALGPGELHDLHLRARRSSTTSPTSRWSTSRSTCSRRSWRTTCRSTSTGSTRTGTTSARSPSTSRATWTRWRARWASRARATLLEPAGGEEARRGRRARRQRPRAGGRGMRARSRRSPRRPAGDRGRLPPCGAARSREALGTPAGLEVPAGAMRRRRRLRARGCAAG